MQSSQKGVIAWFAHNPIAANLLMLFIIVAGLFSALSIQKRLLPPFELKMVSISANYPGAASKEVEEGIAKPIENALENVKGIKNIRTTSSRGSLSATVELEHNQDLVEMTNEIKAKVDAITNFPKGMEKPTVTRVEFHEMVMMLTVSGDVDFKLLKDTGKQVSDDIRQMTGASVQFWGGPAYEISIEIDKEKLREYNLSLSDIADKIRRFSTNTSAGSIKTDNGYVNVRMENMAKEGADYGALPVLTAEDGSQIQLKDIASISDGFEEHLHFFNYDNHNSVGMAVRAYNDQNSVTIADQVKKYLAENEDKLPDGISISPVVDTTFYLQGRLDLMLENMVSGALLVFVILSLFLRVRLAFWVIMGLPISFLGTMMLLPTEWVSISLNMLSLFGFILVLGIVVDDAIVIGESAASEIEKHGQGVDRVIQGVKRVAVPTIFGVLTTVVAFLPMMFSDGQMSAFGKSVASVVVLCLLFSLVESKFILPAHLAHMKVRPENPQNFLFKIRTFIDNGLKQFIANIYQPFLERLIYARYSVMASFVVILMCAAGIFLGDTMRFVGMPKIPEDFPNIVVTMQEKSSEEDTIKAIKRVEKAIEQVDIGLQKEFGDGVIASKMTYLQGRTSAQITVKLKPHDTYPIDVFAVTSRWRDAFPSIPGVKSIEVHDTMFGGNGQGGSDLYFMLMSDNEQQLMDATNVFKKQLASYKGIGDIKDSLTSAADEVMVELKPLAESMGMTNESIAAQMGGSFYGIEVQRILRAGDEIKVMLRYPKSQRESLSQIDDIVINTPSSGLVPLSDLVELHSQSGIGSIHREQNHRIVSIQASIDKTQADAFKLIDEVQTDYIPQLLAQFPEVKTSLKGKIQDEQKELMKTLKQLLMVILMIYALLAIPLKSYSQPFIVMSAIPFGVVGAMMGHLFLGMDMSLFSLFGVVAAVGVVVNDSLVLVDYVNQSLKEGKTMKFAVIEAGGARFRAIILTSLTTFLGLVPIIFETSVQAQMVIPMAVSLAFGILFSTFVTLILIPCLYMILADIKGLFARKERHEGTGQVLNV
ncbi:efflux RND transporter permease subunit [Algicola sagamiensis]|uniref:efflux RND transporter permease subunit n=1 Tax=Algicola sagamiensis TaxID=163869 RepID=UPI0003675418|nr:efflux RND transporter permease subunit [Algicola sagamiensis]